MKKQKSFILLITIITAILAGCGNLKESEIYYDGQLRPISQVEEIIADKLEVENPEFDLEVNVYEESEDE